MTWMNEYDVDNAVRTFERTEDLAPNTAKGARILQRLVRWTNQNSDGWPYWQAPSKAAAKLQDALEEKSRASRIGFGDPEDLTAAELRKLLTPIKSFLTKRGADHGLIFDDPAPPPTEAAAAAFNADPDVLRVVITRANDTAAYAYARPTA